VGFVFDSQMAVNSQRQLPHNALCHRPHTVSRRAAAAAGRVQVMAVATRPPATGTVGNVERKDPDLLGSRRSMVVPVYLCATVSFRGLGSGGYASSNYRFSWCNFFVLLSVGSTQSLSTAEWHSTNNVLVLIGRSMCMMMCSIFFCPGLALILHNWHVLETESWRNGWRDEEDESTDGGGWAGGITHARSPWSKLIWWALCSCRYPAPSCGG